MKQNTSTSALKSHLLSSILPFPTTRCQQHFIKNKEFYKPQQFIWNNPHRTSKRLYPYYHQFQDQFVKKIKPQIQKLEQQDRQNQQDQRIRRLTNLRTQTRIKFIERQKLREQLQQKTRSKKKLRESSTVEIAKQIYPFTQKSKTNTVRTQSLGSFIPNKIITNIQDSYLTSLQNYDLNVNQIQKIVSSQIAQQRNQIRREFFKIKEKNDLNNLVSKMRDRKTHSVKS